jgi:hypothetical protein
MYKPRRGDEAVSIQAAKDAWEEATGLVRARPLVRLFAYVAWCFVLIFALNLLPTHWLRVVSPRYAPVAVFGLIAGTEVVVARVVSARRRVRAAAAMRARGLCPSCGYMMGNPTAEPDGFVVCPECGATWGNLDPVGPTVITVRDPSSPRR